MPLSKAEIEKAIDELLRTSDIMTNTAVPTIPDEKELEAFAKGNKYMVMDLFCCDCLWKDVCTWIYRGTPYNCRNRVTKEEYLDRWR